MTVETLSSPREASASAVVSSPTPCNCDDAIRREIEACLPIFSVLRSQLADVMHDVEHSVVRVCGSFQDIVRRARQTIEQSEADNASPADEADLDMGRLMKVARTTIGDLLGGLESATTCSTDIVKELSAAEGHLKAVAEATDKIEMVATQANMLALNGQIEAARAGKHGAAFGIVATETAKMADQAKQSSRGIRTLVNKLGSEMATTSKDLKLRATEHAQHTERYRAEVDSTFDAMRTASERLEESIAQGQENAAALANDISAAIMAMQFQDAVSQRVQHVIHAIDEIEGALRAHVTEGEPGLDQDTSAHQWAERLRTRYTMSAERQAMDRVLGTNAAAEDNAGGNVELF